MSQRPEVLDFESRPQPLVLDGSLNQDAVYEHQGVL